MGLSSSPGFFQSTIEKLLLGIPNCVAFLDDILAANRNYQEHCRDYGRHLNAFAVVKIKCCLSQKNAKFSASN